MNWFNVLDLIGIFVFAISGAISAKQRQMDLMGMFVLAIVTGVGGGTLRSLFIGEIPPSLFTNPIPFVVSLLAVVIAWPKIQINNKAIMIADAIGLGTFVASGTIVSMDHGLSWWACVALGTITASFGGLLRDILSAQVPIIFRKRIYASACILGGIMVVTLINLGVAKELSIIFCILLVSTVRLLSEHYDWHLPTPK